MRTLNTWVIALSLWAFPHIAMAGIWDYFKKDGVHLVVTEPFIEMRTGPGRGFPVFHSIEKGETLHLFKKRTDWFKAKTQKGIVGWVKRDDLAKTLGPNGETVAFLAPGREDYVDRRYEFGVLYGDFEGTTALTTYASYHLTPNISAELKQTKTFSSIANNTLRAFNMVHKPFPNWRISPFVTLGRGELEISPNASLVQSEERKNSLYTVGGGAFVYISRRFLARIEYNKHTLLTKREANEEVEEWKAGFGVFF